MASSIRITSDLVGLVQCLTKVPAALRQLNGDERVFFEQMAELLPSFVDQNLDAQTLLDHLPAILQKLDHFIPPQYQSEAQRIQRDMSRVPTVRTPIGIESAPFTQALARVPLIRRGSLPPSPDAADLAFEQANKLRREILPFDWVPDYEKGDSGAALKRLSGQIQRLEAFLREHSGFPDLFDMLHTRHRHFAYLQRIEGEIQQSASLEGELARLQTRTSRPNASDYRQRQRYASAIAEALQKTADSLTRSSKYPNKAEALHQRSNHYQNLAEQFMLEAYRIQANFLETRDIPSYEPDIPFPHVPQPRKVSPSRSGELDATATLLENLFGVSEYRNGSQPGDLMILDIGSELQWQVRFENADDGDTWIRIHGFKHYHSGPTALNPDNLDAFEIGALTALEKRILGLNPAFLNANRFNRISATVGLHRHTYERQGALSPFHRASTLSISPKTDDIGEGLTTPDLDIFGIMAESDAGTPEMTIPSRPFNDDDILSRIAGNRMPTAPTDLPLVGLNRFIPWAAPRRDNLARDLRETGTGRSDLRSPMHAGAARRPSERFAGPGYPSRRFGSSRNFTGSRLGAFRARAFRA